MILYIYIYLLKYIALCHNTYIFTSTINTQTKASAAWKHDRRKSHCQKNAGLGSTQTNRSGRRHGHGQSSGHRALKKWYHSIRRSICPRSCWHTKAPLVIIPLPNQLYYIYVSTRIYKYISEHVRCIHEVICVIPNHSSLINRMPSPRSEKCSHAKHRFHVNTSPTIDPLQSSTAGGTPKLGFQEVSLAYKLEAWSRSGPKLIWFGQCDKTINVKTFQVKGALEVRASNSNTFWFQQHRQNLSQTWSSMSSPISWPLRGEQDSLPNLEVNRPAKAHGLGCG